MAPQVLICLANLGRPRRPSSAATPLAERVLPDLATARRQVSGLSDLPVGSVDLHGLRILQRLAVEITDRLLHRRALDPTELNALARGSHAGVHLAIAEGAPRLALIWEDRSVVSHLARRLIEELATIEPDRLRECARPECTLLFYDTTRSRTRRWHAEDPCGWRERQRTHRTNQNPTTADFQPTKRP